MPKESHLEFKVGIFILTGLVALSVYIFSITDKAAFEGGKSVRVVFGFANGLKKNAPVRIAGVDEGIVKNIGLFFDKQDRRTKAAVELWIKKETKVPADSSVIINQLGLLGEKYVEIIPGSDTRHFFEDGKTYVGKDPIAQEAISERVMAVANNVDSAISGINDMVRNEQYQKDIGGTLANINSMTGNIDDILKDIKAGKGTIGKLVYDEGLYDDLHGLTSDLRANPWKLLHRPKR
jgi:phospholipid/cholesterol/gamma-HCH transport system substrate-binding protein